MSTDKTSGTGVVRKLKASAKPEQAAAKVRRGVGDQNSLVSLTVRLKKEDWMRLKMLAMSTGDTLQTVAVRGFNRELAASGQKPIEY